MERQKGDPEFNQLVLRVHHWGTHKPINQVKQGNRCRLKKEDLGSGFEFNLEHWRRNRKMRKEKRQSSFVLSEQEHLSRKAFWPSPRTCCVFCPSTFQIFSPHELCLAQFWSISTRLQVICRHYSLLHKRTGYLDTDTKLLEVWGLCTFKYCTRGSKSESWTSEAAHNLVTPETLRIAALERVIPGSQLCPKASQGSCRAVGAVSKLLAHQSLLLTVTTTSETRSSKQQQAQLKY